MNTETVLKGVSDDPEYQRLMKDSQETIEHVTNFLQHNGVELKFDQWVTIKRYSELFGVDTQVVTNWISRGVIPPDNVRTIEELNDLRLVKAIRYR